MAHTTSIFLLIFLFTFLFVIETTAQTDRVLLKDVTVLTLSNGKMTTGRRSPPMAQLVCIGSGILNSLFFINNWAIFLPSIL